MSRRRVIVNIVEHNFESAMQVINQGNVYVSRYPDGVCVLINSGGKLKDLKFIMYNPESRAVMRTELSWVDFEKMFSEIVMNRSHEHYEVVENGHDIIQYFDSISNALMALGTGSYRGYVVTRGPQLAGPDELHASVGFLCSNITKWEKHKQLESSEVGASVLGLGIQIKSQV